LEVEVFANGEAANTRAVPTGSFGQEPVLVEVGP